MPFVLLIAFAFALGMVLSKPASRNAYFLLLVIAAGATWYYMR